MIVDLVLEGLLEEPVARKIVFFCGHNVGDCFGKNGFVFIKEKSYRYHSITKKGNAVFVLTDFADSKCPCIVEACHQYLITHIAKPDNKFLLRFAVAELESWLLADRMGISNYLGVPTNKIPVSPDTETDPKQLLVNLARKSKRKGIKSALVPSKYHGGVVGPNYRSTMQKFIENVWDIESARKNSPSLERCVSRLMSLA